MQKEGKYFQGTSRAVVGQKRKKKLTTYFISCQQSLDDVVVLQLPVTQEQK